MFIRSERLFLRPGWPEDWSEILARIGDGAVLRNLIRAPWPFDDQAARAFAARQQDARCPHFLVTLPSGEGSRLIGCVGLAETDEGVELGYWIAREHWGQGFATEAVRAVLALARTLGHTRIRARHFIDNPACGRVLRKAGFHPLGDVRPVSSPSRDHAVPALTWELVVDSPSNCDDDDEGAMRAA